MKHLTMTATVAFAALGGCAANVERGTLGEAPMQVPAEASRNVVLDMTGSSAATGSADWEPFKGEWRAAMASAATARGAKFAARDGAVPGGSQPGTLVTVDVADYRYLTPGARFGFGVMTGNAYIDAKVRFADLRTGATFGERSYNTSSSAWQGVFAAMTDKQIQAISQEVIADINPR